MKQNERVKVIATLPPHASHRWDIIKHPLVDELRLNTIMPTAESPFKTLKRLQRESSGKKLWIDLKARQLRITKYAFLPYAYVRLNHGISVEVPTIILFKEEPATIIEVVDANKLILEGLRPKIVGDGQPVNILSPTLRIHGFLTKRDEQFIQAGKTLGIHDYWLSFFESQSDIDELKQRDPDANIVAKIESMAGMRFVESLVQSSPARLMAARDDLFINLGQNKAAIIKALKLIIEKDPEAIVASRILTSLEHSYPVSLADISDLTLMLELGFRTIMTLKELFRALGVAT
jgi:hypothetical protein